MNVLIISEKILLENMKIRMINYSIHSLISINIYSLSNSEQSIVLENKNYDIIFIESNYNYEFILEIVNKYKQNNKWTKIITISKNENSSEIFRYGVDFYFIEPITQKIFNDNLDFLLSDIKEYYNSFFIEEYIYVKIYFRNIMYIEMKQENSKLHLNNNKVIDFNLFYDLKEQLLRCFFCQCHKNFIINVNYIDKIESNNIILMRNIVIPFSKKYKRSFDLEFIKYYNNDFYKI